MGHNKSCSKRAVYSDTSLPQETRNLKKQPNLTPKATRKRTKPKISSREKNHKYQSKRNEVETEKNNGKDQ